MKERNSYRKDYACLGVFENKGLYKLYASIEISIICALA